MRILQVIAAMGVGGAETLVVHLSDGLVAAGDEVAVASAGGEREAALVAAGVQTFRLPLAQRRPHLVLRAAWDVATAIRRFQPDIVVAHNVAAALSARFGILASHPRLPLVTVFHGVAEADYAAAARLYRMCRTTVVVVAEAIGDRLQAAGLPRSAVRRIPNSVPAPPPHDRAAARERLGLPADAPVALCIARLVVQKRHDVLLEAWRAVRGDAVLLVAGDGELRPEIERRAAEPGLAGRVQVLGLRDDVDWLLAAADVFVLASDWEGMPLAVLEAVAAGVPVVATDVDGLRQACGEDAVLVPPREPAALAAAVEKVLAAAPRTPAAAPAARGSAPDLMTRSYRELFTELLAGTQPPGDAQTFRQNSAHGSANGGPTR